MKVIVASIFTVILSGNFSGVSNAGDLRQRSPSVASESTSDRKLLLAQNDRRVPLLRGLIESEARRELSDRGFKGKVTAYVASDKIKCPYEKGAVFPGEVCAAKPDFGERIAANAEISLLIQGEWTGKEPFGIPPKVLGLSRAEAVALLANQGWNVSGLRYRIVESPKCQPGKACDLSDAQYWHSPLVSEGLRAPLPKEIKLRLTIGSARTRRSGIGAVDMIDITGASIDQALEQLDKLGFGGDFITNPPDMACPAKAKEIAEARICLQLPQEGKRISLFDSTLAAVVVTSAKQENPASAGQKALWDTLTDKPDRERGK